MKRVVAMFLGLVLILVVATGCSSQAGQPTPSDSSANNSSTAEQTGNPSSEPKYEPGKYRLNVDHGHTETSVTHEAALLWAEAVRERTHGEVEITVYHSFQLGTADDLLVQIMQGGNTGYLADPGRLGNYWTEIGVLNAPYVVESYGEILQLEDTDLFKEWEDKLVELDDMRVLSWNWGQGFRSCFVNKLCTTPEEFRGVNFRSPEAPVWYAVCEALGTTPVAMAYGDTYSGVQTKLVDGCEQNIGSVYDNAIYEVAPYFIETRHVYLSNAMVVSDTWFQTLPENYQQIVVEECFNAGVYFAEKLAKNESEQIDDMVSKGVTWVKYEDLDTDAFKANAEAFFTKMDMVEARDKLLKALGK